MPERTHHNHQPGELRRRRAMPMIGGTLAVVGALVLAIPVYAQTNQADNGPARGLTTGPAAGSPANLKSPQAGPVATKHQKEVLRRHSEAGAPGAGETGTTGSHSPSNTPSQQ